MASLDVDIKLIQAARAESGSPKDYGPVSQYKPCPILGNMYVQAKVKNITSYPLLIEDAIRVYDGSKKEIAYHYFGYGYSPDTATYIKPGETLTYNINPTGFPSGDYGTIMVSVGLATRRFGTVEDLNYSFDMTKPNDLGNWISEKTEEGVSTAKMEIVASNVLLRQVTGLIAGDYGIVKRTNSCSWGWGSNEKLRLVCYVKTSEKARAWVSSTEYNESWEYVGGAYNSQEIPRNSGMQKVEGYLNLRKTGGKYYTMELVVLPDFAGQYAQFYDLRLIHEYDRWVDNDLVSFNVDFPKDTNVFSGEKTADYTIKNNLNPNMTDYLVDYDGINHYWLRREWSINGNKYWSLDEAYPISDVGLKSFIDKNLVCLYKKQQPAELKIYLWNKKVGWELSDSKKISISV